MASEKVDFSGRFGIGVRTPARTCVAVRNHAVPADSPIVLIEPQAPQTFTAARIAAPSSEACPVSASVNAGLTSYQVSLNESAAPTAKLVPFIVYLGTPASTAFGINNGNVEADLEGNHSRDTFRACWATGGIYLSVWHDSPLVGTRLWAGRYDDSETAGTFPACDPKELQP